MTEKEKLLSQQVQSLQNQLTNILGWIENSLDFEDFHNYYLRQKASDSGIFNKHSEQDN
tara:strand:+ start:76 stop:252 length:177 start_codon:yes stop_codon:yes gene_type:complete